jgi:hypothetical protein
VCVNQRDCLCTFANETAIESAFLQMRRLWEDHVLYTRLAVEEVIFSSPLAGASVARLYSNQDDLGHNLALFFCPANGVIYTAILRRHIDAAVAFLTALIQGNTTAADIGLNAALANAREFAQFWHCVSPFAIEDEVYNHMVMHLTTLADLMRAIIAHDAPLVVSKFDTYSAASRSMADYLVESIWKPGH